MKLTDKQAVLLKAISEGKRCSFHPYMGRFNPHDHYYCQGIGNCTPTAKALLARGLVVKANEERYARNHVLVLANVTDAAHDEGAKK